MKPLIVSGEGIYVGSARGVRIVSDGIKHKVLDADGQEIPGVLTVELALEPLRPAQATITVLAEVDITAYGYEFEKEDNDADEG